MKKTPSLVLSEGHGGQQGASLNMAGMAAIEDADAVTEDVFMHDPASGSSRCAGETTLCGGAGRMY